MSNSITTTEQYPIEPSALEAAKHGKATLAEAADVWYVRESEERQAKRDLAAIEHAWKIGDAGPSAMDYAVAQAGVKRAELLKARAGVTLQTLANSAPITSFELAQRVAELVAPLYGDDVKITISNRLPAQPPKPTAAAPILVIAQTRQAHEEGGGMLAAQLQLGLYSRSKLVSSPIEEELQEAFDSAAWHVKVSRKASRQISGVWLSEVALDVQRGWLPIPLVTGERVQPRHRINELSVMGDLLLRDAITEDTIRILNRAGFSATSADARIAQVGIEQREDVVKESLVAFVKVSVDGREGYRTPTGEAVAAAAAGLRGVLIPGLGVVVSSAVSDDTAKGWPHAVRLSVVRREPLPEDQDDDLDADDLDA